MRYWIKPSNHRYYLAELVQDLFNDWTLICAWGGYGTLRGHHSITGVASYADVTDRPIGATHDRPNGATFSCGFTPPNGVD